MARKKSLPANIRQKSNGSYEARKRVNGIDINLCGSNLEELIVAFEEAKRKAEAKTDVNAEMTLDEWYYKWFASFKEPYLKESSIQPMKGKYRRTIGKKLGKKKINEITNYDMQNALAELKKEGKANSSLKDAFGHVRECFESAKNSKLVEINPCFDLKVPWNVKSKNRRFLSVEEQNAFLLTAKYDREWYYPLFMVMFQTGLRIGEVGGLKWSDIDFDKKVIHVNRSLTSSYNEGVKVLKMTSTKTINSVRDIPFMGNVEEMLMLQKKQQDKIKKELGSRYRSEYDDLTDLVFTSSMGSPVTRYIAEKEINKVVNSYNLQEQHDAVRENRKPIIMDRVHPHAIRRTFCTRCFEADMNPKVVQKLMGHATYSTTIDIYTDVMKDKMDGELEKFTINYTD